MFEDTFRWLLTLASTLLITALSAWVVDGGNRRRARRTIREELELAALLGPGDEGAKALRAAAAGRITWYITPFAARVKARMNSQRFVAASMSVAAFVCAGLGCALLIAYPPPGMPREGAVAAVAVMWVLGVAGGVFVASAGAAGRLPEH